MHFSTATSLLLSLAALAAAQLPAAAIVKQIAPNAENCASSECRTAEQAAPFIAQSMYDYKVFTTPEMAAIISLMAFESGDFKYKLNLQYQADNTDPQHIGQGTANMQMGNFNLLYAKSIPSIKDTVSTFSSIGAMSPTNVTNMMNALTADEFNFASGAWFYTTQCDPSVKQALWANPDAGFKAYMACVGAGVTDDRLAYFTRAKQAFGLN